MKKIFYFFLASFIISCSPGETNPSYSDSSNNTALDESSVSDGKYGIKSGIINQEAEVMGMKLSPVIYFDDYGRKECTETVVDFMGIKSHTMMLFKDGYFYNIDLGRKTGTKMKANSSMANFDIKTLSEEQKKKSTFRNWGMKII